MHARALLLCVSSLVLGAGFHGQLVAQNPKSATRELRNALRQLDEDPASGARLVAKIAQVGNSDSDAAAASLLTAAAEIEKLAAPIVERRRKALLAEGGSGRLKRSRYELQNLDDAAEAIAAALRGMKSTEAIARMLRRLTNRAGTLPLWLRLELAARAGDLPTDGIEWQPAAGKKTSDGTRVALLTACSALGPRAGEGKAGGWIAAQLEHNNPDVRVAAGRAIARVAYPDGIELLIARIDHEQGAVREAVLDSLVVLTGKSPGDSAASWRAWLAAEGAPFLSGDVKLGLGDASMRARKPSDTATSGTYFGIAQTGESILYVFDNSQSMRAKVGSKAKGKAATTGPERQTRWQLCRQELKSALRALSADQKFNLVAFANRVRTFDPKMVPATPENVERATEWLDSLKLEFQTNVFEALEAAFALAGRGAGDDYYRSEVDTIFFLSDGAPTIANLGKSGIQPDDPDRILRAVRRWNALDRVTVHATGIGLQKRKNERNAKGRLFPPVFLRLLAEQNGGEYQAVRR